MKEEKSIHIVFGHSFFSDSIEYILLWKDIYNLLNLFFLYLIWHLLPLCWWPYVSAIDQCACVAWKEEEGWPTKSIRNKYDTAPICYNAFLSVQKLSFPSGPLSSYAFFQSSISTLKERWM